MPTTLLKEGGIRITLHMIQKIAESQFLSHSVFELKLERNLIVTGHEAIQIEHRRVLNYKIRGQVNCGNFYYTGVCIEDPSDAYTAMFKNLLDDQAIGVTSGFDYEKTPYASPILLSKSELKNEEAEKILLQSNIKFFIKKT